MDLWLRLRFLFAALFACGAAPTPEECSQLLAPALSRSKMTGTWTVLLAHTEEPLFQNILKDTDSSWFTFSDLEESNRVLMTEHNRIKGRCFSSAAEASLDQHQATVTSLNVTSVFHMLPSCPDCLVLDINSTVGNLDAAMRLLNMSHATGPEGRTARSIYLMGRGSTVTDADQEVFRRQAGCLGFSRDLHFHYDPEKELCTAEESVKLPD